MAWRGQPKKSKLVVRGLPHALGETDFRQLVKDHLAAVDFFAYFPGRKSSNGVVTASRAFLNFTDQEALFKFSEAFQGHTFVDARGVQTSCSIEYSPFQRTPDASKAKVDPRVGQIEQDEGYIKFMEELKNPPAPPKEDLTPIGAAYNVNDLSKPLSTPILDDLRKKAAMKAQMQQLKIKPRPDRKQRSGGGGGGGNGGSGGKQSRQSQPTVTKNTSGPVRVAQRPYNNNNTNSGNNNAANANAGSAHAPAGGPNTQQQQQQQNRQKQPKPGRPPRGGPKKAAHYAQKTEK